PLASRSATISRASAPQAMIRADLSATTDSLVRLARFSSGATLCNQGLCHFHRNCRVTTVGIGANRLTEGFVQWRSTDHNNEIVADALFLHGVDYHLHIGHGGGEKR